MAWPTPVSSNPRLYPTFVFEKLKSLMSVLWNTGIPLGNPHTRGAFLRPLWERWPRAGSLFLCKVKGIANDECLLYTRHYTGHFFCPLFEFRVPSSSSIVIIILSWAQRGTVTCPEPHSQCMVDPHDPIGLSSLLCDIPPHYSLLGILCWGCTSTGCLSH